VADGFDLDRFVAAQSPVIEEVKRELRFGEKRSHWMWFVFPQLAGLGSSPMAQRYAIASLDEARAYLRHPILGPRLAECAGIVNRVQGHVKRHQEPSHRRHRKPGHPGHADAPAGAGAALDLSSPDRRFSRRR
jgi:uncharacterized protein (DUF1810 family)